MFTHIRKTGAAKVPLWGGLAAETGPGGRYVLRATGGGFKALLVAYQSMIELTLGHNGCAAGDLIRNKI